MSLVSERFSHAARPILVGDDSASAAGRLETVVVDEYLDDPLVEDLLEALSLYGPAGGRPYVSAAELTSLLREIMALMEAATGPGELPMTFHVDGELIENAEQPTDSRPLRALGWLARGEEVPRGECPPQALRALEEAMRHPLARMRGYFQCPFCPLTGMGPTRYVAADGEELLLGDAEVEVPADRVVWRAPSLVLHYIDRHGYGPPTDFLVDIAAQG